MVRLGQRAVYAGALLPDLVSVPVCRLLVGERSRQSDAAPRLAVEADRVFLGGLQGRIVQSEYYIRVSKYAALRRARDGHQSVYDGAWRLRPVPPEREAEERDHVPDRRDDVFPGRSRSDVPLGEQSGIGGYDLGDGAARGDQYVESHHHAHVVPGRSRQSGGVRPNRRGERLDDHVAGRHSAVAAGHRGDGAVLCRRALERLVQCDDLPAQSRSVSAAAGAAGDSDYEQHRQHDDRCGRRPDADPGDDQIRNDHDRDAADIGAVSVFAEIFCQGRHDRRIKRIIKDRKSGWPDGREIRSDRRNNSCGMTRFV